MFHIYAGDLHTCTWQTSSERRRCPLYYRTDDQQASATGVQDMQVNLLGGRGAEVVCPKNQCLHSTIIVYFCLLWPPHGTGQAIIFSFCGFFFLSFFLAYSQSLHIECLPYFHTWRGLSVNLECRCEMCCTRLAENTGRKKIAKNSPSFCAPSHDFVGLYLRN